MYPFSIWEVSFQSYMGGRREGMRNMLFYYLLFCLIKVVRLSFRISRCSSTVLFAMLTIFCPVYVLQFTQALLVDILGSRYDEQYCSD